MNNQKTYRWEWMAVIAYVAMVCTYLIFIRKWIPAVIDESAPAWFQNLITTIYPRLLIEKERFDLAFFISKADQVIFRLGLVSLLGLGFSIWMKKSQQFTQQVKQFWGSRSSRKSIALLRKVYAAIMLLYLFDWYPSLLNVSRLSVFYEPIPLFNFLHIPLATAGVMNSLVLIYVLSLIALFFGKWSWQASILASLCFILFQGYFQCFGKVSHTFTPFIYAALVFPFLMLEAQKSKRNSQKSIANWPLRLIQFAIAACYLFSGLEKLLISQLAWLKPDTIIDYIQLHQAPVGLWLLEYKWIVYFMPLGALFFQFGFISVVFQPKLKKLFLPMGLAFHWGTFFLLGVGWWIHPWQVAYLFFIDWAKVPVFKNLKLN
ncbi:MAG: hypothetical protein ACPGJS_01610 [Flammeovirgaceae bacterium]